MALLAVTLFALAEMTVYVYQKDGTKVEYLAANVDSIGFVNVLTIIFDANGGSGSMDVVEAKEGETITLSANTFTKGSSTFAGWNTATDGSGTAYADQASITPNANIILYAQWVNATTGIENGHEWVDLGLPSGTKWATCNVGADSPEDYGDYFAWGETTTKSTYNWKTYKWCEGSSDTQTKYCKSALYGTVDNKTTLDLADDAANANWGGSWRMPTYVEQDELRNTNYTTWTWTTQNGVSGRKVTSKVNGNSIFLPATGFCNDLGLNKAGSYGCYWTSSLYTEWTSDAYGFCFISSNVCRSSTYARCSGQSVRPVLAK